MIFRISFAVDGAGRSMVIAAESHGEAMEIFEQLADSVDQDLEFLSIVETEA